MAVNVEQNGRVIWLVEDLVKRSGDDTHRVGLISCPSALAKWLDLSVNNKLDLQGLYVAVKQHTRTKSELGKAESGTSTIPKHNRAVTTKNQRGRRVGIITTSKIPSSNPERFHQSSFRVPTFFSIIDTADALAVLIPQEKRTGNQAKMQNFFIWTSGSRHTIMSAEGAKSLTPEQGGSNVAETEAQAKTILEKRNKKD